LRLEGDAGVAGPLVKTGVRCNVPRLEGQAIVVLAEASAPGTAFIIEIRSSEVTVQAYSGSGADYRERHFAGTGVVGFDAAAGVQVDASLADTSTLEHSPGAIGAIGSIRGSVDCGKQTPGAATITITGETGQGAFDHAALAPVLVECSTDVQGNEAFVSAIATRGSSPVEIGLGLSSGGGVSLDLSGGQHFEASGTTTITTAGVHVDADVVETTATTPHTIHIEGDATCGTPA
jgi:hypothetical protein